MDDKAPKGIDVSIYQGVIDWPLVEASGIVQFAYIRSSIGLSSDTNFKRNWDGCGMTGIRRGAYHFFRADADPIRQAEKFFEVVGPLRDVDMPPVLDFEVKKPTNQDVKEFIKGVVSFMLKTEELFQRKCVVYTGGPIFNSETKGADPADIELLSSRDLWLAAYVFDPDKFVPEAWKKRGASWTLWQLSGDVSAGNKPGKKVPGISVVVDYNTSQGAATDLDAWIKSSNLKAPEVKPVEPETPVVVEPPASVEPAPTVQPEIVAGPSTPAEQPTVEQPIVAAEAPVGFLGFLKFIIELLMKVFGRGR